MIRRILAGAAIAAAAIGFSASAASADVGPNTTNKGADIISQFAIIDDLANDSLNHVLHDIEVNIIQIVDELNVTALNNNQPSVGDGNKETDIENGEAHAR